MSAAVQIRRERSGDEAAILALTTTAFETAAHSDGTEAQIVEALRKADALSLSLVAAEGGALVGHIAFSPVMIGGADYRWVGLGPVSVAPRHQGNGIGAALIRDGLSRMRGSGAQGCVVLGEPGYYARFGFQANPALTLPGVPPEYFMALSFEDSIPKGEVAYHPAFGSI
ncbi:GNAT family N-acetyltransferase [Paracoccus sediminicola]|uniref:GNAT family N-acetyltransferase n=1 Tax=Paracoccus sediminicola TaxID=3017783 RepID=UPI0022F02C65|nr:N-acetyltransferase [Paracoccus sediminicola]WBU56912.1 N-acetyltransferase [Paracoccus sediminicola]